MITVELNRQSSARVAAMLRRKRVAILAEVETTMNSVTVDLQTYVKTNKLAGRPGLRNITGNLRRSIKRAVTKSEEGVTGTVGVGVEASKYAKIHEFGFDGPEQVKAHTRRIGFNKRGGRVSLRMASGRKRRVASVSTVTVRSFVRHMHMPQRSFLRSSLAENRVGIAQRIQNAIQAGLTR